MKDNTTEKTPYQILLEKLDDEDFAERFFAEKQKEAEYLLADILGVTSGASEVVKINDDWGQKALYQVFELLSIRHKNFYLPDFISNLQEFLFRWTWEYSERHLRWRDVLDSEIFALSDDEKTGEAAEGEKSPLDLSQMSAETLGTTDAAKCLSDVLNNPNIPETLTKAIESAMNDLRGSKAVSDDFDNSPESIAEILFKSKRAGGK